jgi:hypothetical protein
MQTWSLVLPQIQYNKIKGVPSPKQTNKQASKQTKQSKANLKLLVAIFAIR